MLSCVEFVALPRANLKRLSTDQQNESSSLSAKCGLKMGCLEMSEKQPVDKSNRRGKMRLHWQGFGQRQ